MSTNSISTSPTSKVPTSTSGAQTDEDFYKNFYISVKSYNPSYFDPIDPVHNSVFGSDVESNTERITFTYVIAVSKIIDDTVTPHTTVIPPTNISARTLRDNISNLPIVKGSIVNITKFSSQAFKLVTTKELNLESFEPILSPIGWIQIINAPKIESVNYIFYLAPSTTNEDAVSFFSRFGVLDVWRRYVGTVSDKLGSGAIVWFKTINNEMLRYFYTSKEKRRKWKQQIVASSTTFGLTCDSCSLRYHKNTNCPYPNAPNEVPERYKKFFNTKKTSGTSPTTQSKDNNNSTPSIFTPAKPGSSYNNINSSIVKNKRKPRPPPEVPRPLEQVTCYNCDKKGHYANKCVNARVWRPIGNKQTTYQKSITNHVKVTSDHDSNGSKSIEIKVADIQSTTSTTSSSSATAPATSSVDSPSVNQTTETAPTPNNITTNPNTSATSALPLNVESLTSVDTPNKSKSAIKTLACLKTKTTASSDCLTSNPITPSKDSTDVPALMKSSLSNKPTSASNTASLNSQADQLMAMVMPKDTDKWISLGTCQYYILYPIIHFITTDEVAHSYNFIQMYNISYPDSTGRPGCFKRVLFHCKGEKIILNFTTESYLALFKEALRLVSRTVSSNTTNVTTNSIGDNQLPSGTEITIDPSGKMIIPLKTKEIKSNPKETDIIEFKITETTISHEADKANCTDELASQ